MSIKSWHIVAISFYLAMKRNKLLLHETMQTVMLSFVNKPDIKELYGSVYSRLKNRWHCDTTEWSSAAKRDELAV